MHWWHTFQDDFVDVRGPFFYRGMRRLGRAIKHGFSHCDGPFFQCAWKSVGDSQRGKKQDSSNRNHVSTQPSFSSELPSLSGTSNTVIEKSPCSTDWAGHTSSDPDRELLAGIPLQRLAEGSSTQRSGTQESTSHTPGKWNYMVRPWILSLC